MTYSPPWSENLIDAFVEVLEGVSELAGDDFTVQRVQRYDGRKGRFKIGRPPAIGVRLVSLEERDSEFLERVLMTATVEILVLVHAETREIPTNTTSVRAGEDVARAIRTRVDWDKAGVRAKLQSTTVTSLEEEDARETRIGALVVVTVSASVDPETRQPIDPE